MDQDDDIPGNSDEVELVTFLARHDDSEESISSGENDATLKDNNGVYHYNEAIDYIGFGIFHIIQTITVGIALSSDAIEVLVISLALPQLSHDLNATDLQNAWLSSVIFMGMLVGDYGWGTLADIIGRRSTMVISLSINGLAGFLSALAPNYGVFLTLRFIGGIGIGGSLAIMMTYVSEFITAKWRGKYLGALATFWTFGKILVGGIAYFILPLGCKITINLGYLELHSWNVFLIIASIPALLGAGLFALLPESPLFLLRVRKDQKAIGVLRKMLWWNQLWRFGKNKQSFPIKQVILPAKNYHILTPARFKGLFIIRWLPKRLQDFIWRPLPLFQWQYLRRTLLQLEIYFLLALAVYGLTLWYPTYINNLEHQCEADIAHKTASDLPNICPYGSHVEHTDVKNFVWHDKHLKNAVFDHVKFQDTNFTHSSFEDCTFLNCSFHSVNLLTSSFINTCFKNTVNSSWTYDNATFMNSYYDESLMFGSDQPKPCCYYDNCQRSCYDDANVDYNKIYLELFYVALATVPGCIMSAIIVDLLRRSYWLAILFILSAGSCVLLFFFKTPTLAIVALIVFSFFSVGTWNTSSLISKEVYPTELRYEDNIEYCNMGMQLCSVIVTTIVLPLFL